MCLICILAAASMTECHSMSMQPFMTSINGCIDRMAWWLHNLISLPLKGMLLSVMLVLWQAWS
jgi:hypothetical protein